MSHFFYNRNGYFDTYSLKYDQSTNNEGGYFAKVFFTKDAISDCSDFNELLTAPSTYDLYIKFNDYNAYSKYISLFEYFKD